MCRTHHYEFNVLPKRPRAYVRLTGNDDEVQVLHRVYQPQPQEVAWKSIVNES